MDPVILVQTLTATLSMDTAVRTAAEAKLNEVKHRFAMCSQHSFELYFFFFNFINSLSRPLARAMQKCSIEIAKFHS